MVRSRRRIFDGTAIWEGTSGGTDIGLPITAPFAGAPALGSVSYTIPGGATVRYISLGGNDTTGTGAIGTPWATLDKAMQSAPDGAYVAVRGGSSTPDVYFEGDHSSTPSGKVLHVQPYQDEQAIFDGSRVVSTGAWTNIGTNLYRTSYTPKPLSSSVTAGLNVNRRACDQLFIDDVRWIQIADSTTPTANKTFSVDRGANTMTAYVTGGVSGKVTKVSDKSHLFNVIGPTTFTGLQFQYYTPGQVSAGTSRQFMYFNVNAGGSVIDRCIFKGSSACFLEFQGSSSNSNPLQDVTVKNTTFKDFGTTGLTIGRTQTYLVEYNLIYGGNKRGWAAQPESGGFKMVSTDLGVVRYNYTYDCPAAMGNWFDVSNIRCQYYNNVVDGRDFGTGLYGEGRMEDPLNWEESDGGFVGGVQYRHLIVGNLLRGGKNYASLVYVSGYLDWWNNSFKEAGIGQLNFQQDRVNNPNTSNVDDIDRLGTIAPWDIRHQRFYNNITDYSVAGAGTQIVAEDTFGGSGPYYLGWDRFDEITGNWFKPAPPGTMVKLGKTGGGSTSFNTLSALQSSTSTVGGPPGAKLGINYQGTATPDANTYAKPLPTNVAVILGVASGSKQIGPSLALLPVPIAGG